MIMTSGRASIPGKGGFTLLCVLVLLCVPRFTAAQEPPAPQAVPAAQLQAAIDKLGDLDYATRSNAARTVRRVPAAQAVPALLQTVAEHADGYVRYRALVLLTGFNDPRTKGRDARGAGEPQRSAAHRRLQLLRAQPGCVAMIPPLLAALDKEQGGVRPAGAHPRAGGARLRLLHRPTSVRVSRRSCATSAAARTSSAAP